MSTMAKRSMTLDLFATLDIIDDDVTAIVDAYLADPTSRMIAFGDGYRIDPAAAVASHPFANALMGQPWADEALRRAAVRAAILLAEPERVSVGAHAAAWAVRPPESAVSGIASVGLPASNTL